MKGSTTGYCSCYARLFSCATESKESKKLRGMRDILDGHFGNFEFICAIPTPDPTWSFNITADCLQELSCSSLSEGSILKSSILELSFSNSRFKSNYQCVQCLSRLCVNSLCYYSKSFLAVKSNVCKCPNGSLVVFPTVLP